MIRSLLTLAAVAALSGNVIAAGDHASGHGHGDHAGGHGHGDHHGKSTAGTPGDPAKAKRTIKITMDDTMRFSPSTISAKRGETLRLQVSNVGKVAHELVIGPKEELMAHAELMRKFPGMEHDEPNMIRLEPGASGDIVWQFDQDGSVDFACLIPGHMEAGMVGTVKVGKK